MTKPECRSPNDEWRIAIVEWRMAKVVPLYCFVIRITSFVICPPPISLQLNSLPPCHLGDSIEQRAAAFAERYKAVYNEIGKVIVGHGDIVHGVLTCLFCGGHTLLEGVPGLGKTLLVKTLSDVLGPRLQPHPVHARPDAGRHPRHEHDRRGSRTGRRAFEFQRGPIFTQICLADEINRATPKTQSALLEAMQEKHGDGRRHDVRPQASPSSSWRRRTRSSRRGPTRSPRRSSTGSSSSSSSATPAGRS